MKVSFITAILLFGASFCASPVLKPQSVYEVIAVARSENRKYNITATFYGTDLVYGTNNELTAKIIRRIVFRKNDAGEEVRYYPKESEGEQHAEFYFTGIWSPDEEHLVLPIGRFDGFGIIKSSSAMKALKNNDFLDKIRVFNGYENKSESDQQLLWHDFKGWKTNSSISFNAGLDGVSDDYRYDFVSKKLTAPPESVRATIKGENISGEIPLSSGANF